MSSECSGIKIIIPPNPEKIVAAKKRDLSIQARTVKKTLEVDPLKNRLDVKKKDEKADMIAHKYSTANLRGSLALNKPNGGKSNSILIG